MKDHYDFLIAGAGLYGAVMARELMDAGYSVLVLEKRSHIGGNAYTREDHGILVHQYGAHIFHTASERVWKYANRFAGFNRFTNSPLAFYKGKMYSLPFNMHTYSQLWQVTTPAEAAAIIEKQRSSAPEHPANLEEQAISLVGKDLYRILIQGYTEKQWGRPCRDLPAFIIRRIPVRMTWDNNYFNDPYQGIPQDGYTAMIGRMLEGADLILEEDFLLNREKWSAMADNIIFTGPLDAWFDYCLGPLEYRTLHFEEQLMDTDNFQGNAVVNYTEAQIPWTRIIEHKWFANPNASRTIISREYPGSWKPGMEPYYPVNDDKNNALYLEYKAMADKLPNVIFGGRLGEYRYYDMDQVILSALCKAEEIIQKEKS